MFFLALVTESENRQPWKKELVKFAEAAERAKTFMLGLVERRTSEEREKVIKALERRDFREAARLLNGDLLEMADWLREQQKKLEK